MTQLTADIVAHAVIGACKAHGLDPVEVVSAADKTDMHRSVLGGAAASLWDCGPTTQHRAAQIVGIPSGVLAIAINNRPPRFFRSWQRANGHIWRALPTGPSKKAAAR